METQKVAVADSDSDTPSPEAKAQGEKVFRFVLPGPGGNSNGENGRDENNRDENAPQKRDWSSAIDLVNEACEAVRLAEERAVTAERYSQQLNQYYAEQVRGLEVRLLAAEKRGEAANTRAAEAEEWLVRFHDAIVSGFKGVLDQR